MHFQERMFKTVYCACLGACQIHLADQKQTVWFIVQWQDTCFACQMVQLDIR